MAVFFTSDTHFNSERTLELSRRPFSSVQEMNDKIISNWNNTVKSDDVVFHLGDFGDGSFITKLNGKVVLLYGNYEFGDDSSIKKYIQYFEKVLPFSGYMIDFTKFGKYMYYSKYNLHLCHKPSNMITDCFNLFGHVHQLSMLKKHLVRINNNNENVYACGLNVGIDIFWKPVDLNVIEFYKNGVYYHYDKEVFW